MIKWIKIERWTNVRTGLTDEIDPLDVEIYDSFTEANEAMYKIKRKRTDDEDCKVQTLESLSVKEKGHIATRYLFFTNDGDVYLITTDFIKKEDL